MLFYPPEYFMYAFLAFLENLLPVRMGAAITAHAIAIRRTSGGI
jgi:hypothetical protein